MEQIGKSAKASEFIVNGKQEDGELPSASASSKKLEFENLAFIIAAEEYQNVLLNYKKQPFLDSVNGDVLTDCNKVLNQRQPFLELERISLIARDSWRQSNFTKYNSTECKFLEEAQATDNLSVDTKNILVLNDDCLEHICKMLKFIEQVRFSLVCQRFCDVFVMRSKTEYKRFPLCKLGRLTISEICDFFKYCGKSIVQLKASYESVHLMAILKKYGLTQLLISLREINLGPCNLCDNSITWFLEFKNLETLSVAGNYDLTGQHLHNFKRLVSLDLRYCSNILGKRFVLIFKSLKALKSLNIRGCKFFTTHILHQMLKYCHNLVELQMSIRGRLHYEDVALLPQLKRLELDDSLTTHNLREQLFEQLVAHKSTQLEHFQLSVRSFNIFNGAAHLSKLENLKYLSITNSLINDTCLLMFGALKHLEQFTIRSGSSITNTGLIGLLRKCINLNYLNLQDCRNINDQFVYGVIKLMKTRGSQQRHVLLCKFGGTSIKQSILNDAEYKNAAEYLKLSFCFDSEYFSDSDCENESDSDEYWNAFGLDEEDLRYPYLSM